MGDSVSEPKRKIRKTGEEPPLQEVFFKKTDENIDYDDWMENVSSVILKDTDLVDEKWREKYEEKASEYWDQFYGDHGNRFFKPRRYLHRAFPSLQPKEDCSEKRVLLDIGCGVGDGFFPLLALHPSLHVIAFDFSAEAVDVAKSHPSYPTHAHRLSCFSYDITTGLPASVPLGSVHYALCVFVLSAISPHLHRRVLESIFQALAPGGQLLFRDYGRGDMAQVKLAKKLGHCLEEGFYVKQDGTRVFYFEKDALEKVLKETGFRVDENLYCLRAIENRKRGLVAEKAMRRVWVQVIATKPDA
eukprot:GCRY01003245.1.p1 GENE.GCRY01003245.1~~GCRY01003245.1.p1  ORF type:complete len:302 (+),score=86.41 GCRY01003245.1:174-1079(+)